MREFVTASVYAKKNVSRSLIFRCCFRRFDLRPRGRTPEVKDAALGVGAVHGTNDIAVGRKGHGHEDRSLTFQSEQFLVAFHAPKLDRLFPTAARHEALAIG